LETLRGRGARPDATLSPLQRVPVQALQRNARILAAIVPTHGMFFATERDMEVTAVGRAQSSGGDNAA